MTANNIAGHNIPSAPPYPPAVGDNRSPNGIAMGYPFPEQGRGPAVGDNQSSDCFVPITTRLANKTTAFKNALGVSQHTNHFLSYIESFGLGAALGLISYCVTLAFQPALYFTIAPLSCGVAIGLSAGIVAMALNGFYQWLSLSCAFRGVCNAERQALKDLKKFYNKNYSTFIKKQHLLTNADKHHLGQAFYMLVMANRAPCQRFDFINGAIVQGARFAGGSKTSSSPDGGDSSQSFVSVAYQRPANVIVVGGDSSPTKARPKKTPEEEKAEQSNGEAEVVILVVAAAIALAASAGTWFFHRSKQKYIAQQKLRLYLEETFGKPFSGEGGGLRADDFDDSWLNRALEGGGQSAPRGFGRHFNGIHQGQQGFPAPAC